MRFPIWKRFIFGSGEDLTVIERSLRQVGINASRISTVHGDGIKISLGNVYAVGVPTTNGWGYVGTNINSPGTDSLTWKGTFLFSNILEIFYLDTGTWKGVVFPHVDGILVGPKGAIGLEAIFQPRYLRYTQLSFLIPHISKSLYLGCAIPCVQLVEENKNWRKFRYFVPTPLLCFALAEAPYYSITWEEIPITGEVVINGQIFQIRAFQSTILTFGDKGVAYLGFAIKA